MRFFRLISASVLCFLIFSCSITPEENTRKLTVFYSVDNASTLQNITIINSLTQFCEEQEMIFNFVDCAGNYSAQKSSLAFADENYPDILLISAVGYFGLEEEVLSSIENGSRIIMIDSQTRATENLENSSIIMSDHIEQGTQCAQALAAYFHGRPGLILEIQGPLGSSSTRDKSLGFRLGLQDHDNLELIDVYENCLSRQDAYVHTKEALQVHGSSVMGVAAQTDELGLGVLDALLETDIDIPIVSIGGRTDVKKAIRSTSYYATVEPESLTEKLISIISGNMDSRIILKSRLLTEEDIRDWTP